MNRDLFQIILQSPERFPNLWTCQHSSTNATTVVAKEGVVNYTQIFKSSGFYYPDDSLVYLHKTLDDLERILISNQEPKEWINNGVPMRQMGSFRNRVLAEGVDLSPTLMWLRIPSIYEISHMTKCWIFEVTIRPW